MAATALTAGISTFCERKTYVFARVVLELSIIKAALDDDESTLLLLLACNVDVNTVNPVNVWIPLIATASLGNTAVPRWLSSSAVRAQTSS